MDWGAFADALEYEAASHDLEALPLALHLRLFEAYEVFGGRTDDPSLYGLYKPCGGCDFMEECAESLPYCPDEEAAEAMASAAWQSGC